MKALDSRADKIATKKWQAKWHEASERMRIAIGYLAIGDRERALQLVRPAMAVRGSDTYGDTLEWCARDAIALGLRLEPGNKRLAKQFVEVGKIIDKEFEKKGTWLVKPKPKVWAKLADEAVHLDLDKALWHVNTELYACFVAMAQDPASSKALEPVVEKILAAIARTLGGGTPQPAVGAAVNLGKLQELADREKHPLVRERLQAMAWRGKGSSTTKEALDVATAYLALGRPDDARLFANAVLKETNPKQHGKNNEYTGALAVLIEAGDETQLKLFEDTNNWTWDDGAKAWKEFANELDAHDIAHDAFPSALRTARGLVLQAIGGTHLRRAAKVAPKLRKAVDTKLLPALRTRLASKADAKLADLIRSFGAPKSASLKPLPAALDPKREPAPVLAKLLARVTSKPALRGSQAVQDVLVVALARAALGRQAEALAALDTVADIGFGGDHDLWYMVGLAVAVRGRLSKDPKRDAARLAWRPFSSLDDDWLAEQAARVRTFPAQAAECASKRPSDRVFGRLAYGLSWSAFATISPAMKSHVKPAEITAAWTAGLDAFRALLGPGS